MRKIKFRAWDKSQVYMAYQGTPDLETFQSFVFHFGEDVLMQFTGLKDKNGKEIYEGDILKLMDGDISHHEIYWHKERAMFIDRRLEDGDSLSAHLDGDISFVSDCEIVGNIYENPELLP